MIDEIISAVRKEAEAYSKANGDFIGQVILKTDFKDTGEATYLMPLAMLAVRGGDETSQWCGGVTRADWNWAFNLYNYMPDAYGDDTSGDSEALLKWTDDVRRHFSTRQWLTPAMGYIEQRYNFRFTLSGVQEADALKYREGLCMGWRFMFDAIAIDVETDSISYSPDATLQKVVPLPADNT